MKVDFIADLADFKRLVEHHRIMLYQIKNGDVTIRAGRFGFAANEHETPKVYQEAVEFLKKNPDCALVSESIPEELVFA